MVRNGSQYSSFAMACDANVVRNGVDKLNPAAETVVLACNACIRIDRPNDILGKYAHLQKHGLCFFLSALEQLIESMTSTNSATSDEDVRV
jgi:hypothetical protein